MKAPYDRAVDPVLESPLHDFEAPHDFVAVFDPDGELLYSSRPSGIMGEDLVRAQVLAGETLRAGHTMQRQIPEDVVDGFSRSLEMRSSLLFDSNGGRPCVAVVYRDVTYRKKVEAQLRKLFRVVEQSPACIMITDTEGNIEYVNPKFCELTGYSFDEAIGKNPRILKSGEMTSDGYQEMWTAISSGREWKGEFHNRKKNGELYWEFASISPVKDAAGRITHYVAVKEDVTERKHIDEERLKLVAELQQALAKVKTLTGLLPICAWCKKVRDDEGYWKQIESYVEAHSEAEFTHGICPDCAEKHLRSSLRPVKK